jgi:hypothetical protein
MTHKGCCFYWLDGSIILAKCYSLVDEFNSNPNRYVTISMWYFWHVHVLVLVLWIFEVLNIHFPIYFILFRIKVRLDGLWNPNAIQHHFKFCIISVWTININWCFAKLNQLSLCIVNWNASCIYHCNMQYHATCHIHNYNHGEFIG